MIRPASETGAAGAFARQSDPLHRLYRETPFARLYRPDRVYLTISANAAALYAGMAAGCKHGWHHCTGGCTCPPDPYSPRGGDVYRVEPEDGPDPEGPGVDYPGFVCAGRARVLRVVARGVERYWTDWPHTPGAPWFHGGAPGLDVGDVLQPSDVTVADGRQHRGAGRRCRR